MNVKRMSLGITLTAIVIALCFVTPHSSVSAAPAPSPSPHPIYAAFGPVPVLDNHNDAHFEYVNPLDVVKIVPLAGEEGPPCKLYLRTGEVLKVNSSLVELESQLRIDIWYRDEQ